MMNSTHKVSSAMAPDNRLLPVGVTAWLVFAVVLAAVPLLPLSSTAQSILSQIGIVMIFSLSYNMLLGQAGMLSFGHAVYSGLGAFVSIHAMNWAAGNQYWLPVPVVPIIGALAGMLFGAIFGYVTTKKSGTTFAMITLGVVELVFACSLMFPSFFGGEGGITTNRVYGDKFLGLDFSSQWQVYYLVACWLLISMFAMYAFTKTPLGRIVNAVRDNPERAEFVGYDTQWVRYINFILAGFFAGVSGGLSAINFEIVSAENVSAMKSGAVLLFTFIGGMGNFFGPMIGAAVGVLMTVMLSDYTKAWSLYLGATFILIVLFVPGGISSLVMMMVRIVEYRKFKRLAWYLVVMAAALLVVIAGSVIGIEMAYHHTLESMNSTVMTLGGMALDTAKPAGWIVAVILLALGGAAYWRVHGMFIPVWHAVNVDIESEIFRRASE